MKLIDLTHTFTCDMPVYPGDPPAGLEPIATIAKDGFNDCCVRGGLHVGTHMDAPLHMIEGGAPLSDIPLRQFFGRGRLIDARGYKAVTADLALARLAGSNCPAVFIDHADSKRRHGEAQVAATG